uniref:Capsid protein n=1 Tax=Antarctic circular DNA molecule TaxID=2664238 RepID=A0A5Q2F0B7_9ZZZZ|nr:capsid protein [Antarctic circular DNA molecule]
MLLYNNNTMARKQNQKSSWEKKGASIGGSIGAIASKVKNIIEELNVEQKHVGTTINSTATNTGLTTYLLNIPQGLGSSDRTGNSLKLTSAFVRFNAFLNIAVPTNCIIRVLMFKDNQQIGDTTPLLTDVLESVSVYSGYNTTLNVGRFTVMYDKTFNLTTVAMPVINVQKIYKKMNQKVKYNGVAGADIQKDGIYFSILSNITSNYPTVRADVRMRFVDN